MNVCDDDEIQGEIDVPFEDKPAAVSRLSDASVEELEKRVKLASDYFNVRLKDNALRLIVFCIVTIILICVADSFLINFNLKTSAFLNGTFELFKFLLSSLIGYLFATKKFE